MRKMASLIVIVLLCSSILFVLMSRVCAQDINSGLVGYWKLDEGSGNVGSDSSGNGNNGTLTNSPAWVAGKNGTALRFDGFSNNVVVPDSSSLHLSSAVTVMAWVYLPAGAHYGESRILSKDASNGGSNLDLDIHDDSGHVSFDLGYGSGFAGPVIVSTVYVPRNVWVPIAATYDGSVAKIYINGVLDSTAPWTYGFNTNNSMPLCIGSKNYLGALGGPFYQFFINATIDEVRLYNVALSQQEIQTVVAIPEFPSFFILPLFMIATLLAVVVYRRKTRSDAR
jgi:hypothetical protein